MNQGKGIRESLALGRVPASRLLLVFKGSLTDEVTFEQRFERRVGPIQVTSGGCKNVKASRWEYAWPTWLEQFERRGEWYDEIRESTGGPLMQWCGGDYKGFDFYPSSEMGSPDWKRGVTPSDFIEKDCSGFGVGPGQGCNGIMHAEHLIQSLVCSKWSAACYSAWAVVTGCRNTDLFPHSSRA